MTFEEQREELGRLALAEYEGLDGKAECEITLDPRCAVKLLFALARASHHTKGKVREFCRDLGADLQRAYLEPGSVLDRSADLMWERDDYVLTLTERIRDVPDAFRVALSE